MSGSATTGLERLVDGLFDYAGMYPPASLSLDQALRESARFPKLHRPHLVGNDLVADLKEVPKLTRERLLEAGYARDRLGLCVVGVAVAQAQAAADALAGLPAPLELASLEMHGAAWSPTAMAAAADLEPQARAYFEPRWPEAEWEDRAPGLLADMVLAGASGVAVGLKFRGAGPYALSNRTLRWLLPAVVEAGLPLKATQGLHHPILEERHGNALGFVGIAVGLRLLQVVTLGFSDHLDALLAERDPKAFLWGGKVSWRGHRMDLDDLGMAMEELPFAIGSCSLAEPDDDLQRLWPVRVAA